ncbi:hypothetical protein NP493_539g01015 [Ridgeia piscesae]|uniref:KY-like immunoglobulin-like domain-containing protein n=1 Tax=Ridgeia piscesae TaxID=27915 RepID=A0AAD9KWC6_RIDPI|nr:hypothetical protein NP493_539g01015 [Ridgeia piscesae]
MHLLQPPRELLYGSYAPLAKYLTRSCRSDVSRVAVLFQWTTSRNYNDIDSYRQEVVDPDSPLKGFLDIADKKNNHAHFFTRLCRAAGIACVVISGVTKNGSYVVGERRLRRKQERRAQWNAVLVDGEWRLLDVLWASCALVRRRVAGWALIDVDGERLAGEQEDDSPGEKRYRNNEFFFLTDPDQFVCTHLPNDPAWQLLPNPLSVKQFETFFYVRERFFDLGLTMVMDSQRSCVVKTTDAEVTIAFGLPTSPVARAQFRYLLFRDQEEDASGENEVAPSRASVFFHQSDERISYTCRMEEVGRYRMDIFGRHTDRHDRMDLVCSYIIVCESTTGRRLPAVSDIGWGPGPTLDEAGLIAVTHDSGIIYADSSEITLVHLKTTDKHMVFWHCLKHDTLRGHACIASHTAHAR